jgi:alpha-L-rhamnosidase
VEHLGDALGIDTVIPRLSWWLPRDAERQLAFRIETDNGWDSGRVDSDESVLIDYGGPPLHAAQRVSWQVMVWTDQGESAWSDPGAFELGLLGPEDWSARWVEPVEREPGPPGARAAALLRGEFTLARPVQRARLYATAHGIYEAFLNGRRVGDAELTPGYTAYGKRLQVQTYDVTELLAPGANGLGALLSDGWFRGQVGLPRSHDQWGSRLAFLAQLAVEYEDGARSVFGTGEDWHSHPAHVVADLIAGQRTDLRRLPDGWDRAGFTAAGWDRAAVADHGYARLVSSPAPPVRAVEALRPVEVRRVRRGQVFDLGQNINGWARLRDLGPGGTTLTLEHGEAVDAAGDVTTDHLMVNVPFIPHPLPAGQVDVVIGSGRPGASFEPRHTTHGFRYVRVEGHPGELDAGDLSGVVVHTDMARTGWFRCSDERINRLHDAAVWSFRGNACDIPTDCPTRERGGWTGDWQIFVPTAAFLYDVAGFSTKWLRDVAAEQWSSGVVAGLAPSPPAESEHGFVVELNGSAGWGDAAVIVPWEIYRAYGDRRVLDEQWPSMVAWLGHVESAAAQGRHRDRIARSPRPDMHERYLWDTGFHFGEWLEPGQDLSDFEAFKASDKADVATAFFAHSARLMSRIAELLGRGEDATRYRDLADNVRAAWQTEFIGPEGALAPDTQANHVRALAFDLVPQSLRAQAAGRLVELIEDADMHLGTGFLATPYLLPVLADTGHLDVAYALLFRDTPPSWLSMIDRGATTIWERWNGIDEKGTPFESLNHYSRGAVVSFLHRYVAGIELLDDGPGYRRFRVAPRPGPGITWAEATHDSPYGRIESSWRLAAGELTLTAVVPPGASAELVLPDGTRRTVAAGRHAVRAQSQGRIPGNAGGSPSGRS